VVCRYESRDAAVNEMAALKAQADKEQAAFEAEWKELGKLIEHDRRVREALMSSSASPRWRMTYIREARAAGLEINRPKPRLRIISLARAD
jgi:hypothetical protein